MLSWGKTPFSNSIPRAESMAIITPHAIRCWIYLSNKLFDHVLGHARMVVLDKLQVFSRTCTLLRQLYLVCMKSFCNFWCKARRLPGKPENRIKSYRGGKSPPMITTCNNSVTIIMTTRTAFISLTSKCWFCCVLMVHVPEPAAYWDRSMACRLEAVCSSKEWLGVYIWVSLNTKEMRSRRLVSSSTKGVEILYFNSS